MDFSPDPKTPEVDPIEADYWEIATLIGGSTVGMLAAWIYLTFFC